MYCDSILIMQTKVLFILPLNLEIQFIFIHSFVNTNLIFLESIIKTIVKIVIYVIDVRS